MKKVLFAVAIASVSIVACNNADSDKKATDSPVVVAPVVVKDSPVAPVVVKDSPVMAPKMVDSPAKK